jgi:hypothetical protein
MRPDLAEVDLFILDELALRKNVDAGRYAYLVVADLPGQRWCVWSTADLVLATKTSYSHLCGSSVPSPASIALRSSSQGSRWSSLCATIRPPSRKMFAAYTSLGAAASRTTARRRIVENSLPVHRQSQRPPAPERGRAIKRALTGSLRPLSTWGTSGL